MRHQWIDFVEPLFRRLSAALVSVTVVAIPLVFLPGARDGFRLPKLLLLHASGVALATTLAIAAVLGVRITGIHWRPEVRAVVLLAMAWTAATIFFSSNVLLSVLSLLTLASALMFFVASYNTAAKMPLSWIWVGLAPAAINAMVAIAQWIPVWDPFGAAASKPQHLRAIALLGNTNDAGMLLVAPTLAAVAAALTLRRHRSIAVIVALVLLAGVAATETIGAVVAVGMGLLVFAVQYRRIYALWATLIMLVLGFAGLRASPTHWPSVVKAFAALRTGDLDFVLSGRVPAFLAAWELFKEDPVTGTGPGTFGYRYFDQKIALERSGQFEFIERPVNFAEVHNDHLQVLAETGIPGYAIFLSAFLLLARAGLKPHSCTSLRTLYARRLALPLAVGIGTLALSSFPFRLAAPMTASLFFAALVLSWSTHASD